MSGTTHLTLAFTSAVALVELTDTAAHAAGSTISDRFLLSQPYTAGGCAWMLGG